jgi:hypothetical protein
LDACVIVLMFFCKFLQWDSSMQIKFEWRTESLRNILEQCMDVLEVCTAIELACYLPTCTSQFHSNYLHKLQNNLNSRKLVLVKS